VVGKKLLAHEDLVQTGLLLVSPQNLEIGPEFLDLKMLVGLR